MTRADGSFTFTIPKDRATLGAHTLFIRVQDSPDRNWSLTQWKATTIVYCTPADQPAAVTSQTVCAGSTATFTIPAVALTTGYRWAAPAGWTIVGGQGTGTITLKSPAVTTATSFSTLSVAAYNGCDTSQLRTFSALVNALPGRPTVTVRGDTALVSSAAIGNQWFMNGTAIGGATNPSYRPLAAGQFTVQVTQSGCGSLVSDVYNRIITGLEESALPGLRLVPQSVYQPDNHPNGQSATSQGADIFDDGSGNTGDGARNGWVADQYRRVAGGGLSAPG